MDIALKDFLFSEEIIALQKFAGAYDLSFRRKGKLKIRLLDGEEFKFLATNFVRDYKDYKGSKYQPNNALKRAIKKLSKVFMLPLYTLKALAKKELA